MPKASTFGHLVSSQVIDSDCIPIVTNAGDNKLLPVSEARTAIGPGYSSTVNAYNEAGITREIKIQAAITRAISTGAARVFVPTSMLPYDASLITFNAAVQMVREGGDLLSYDAQAYGAAGDGIQNDTVAIQASITAMPLDSGYWLLPPGEYLTTAAVVFPRHFFNSTVVFAGRIRNDTTDGVLFQDLQECEIRGLSVWTYPFDAWAVDRAGVRISGYMVGCTLDVRRSVGFKKGIYFDAVDLGESASRAHNKIYLGTVRNNQHGVHVECTGAVGNYFNANSFYDGDLANENKATTTGSWGFYFTGSNTSTRIFAGSWQTLHGGLYAPSAAGMTVVGPYIEAVDTLLDVTSSSTGTWVHGMGDFPDQVITRSVNMTGWTFLNTGKQGTSNPTMRVDKTGIAWDDNADATHYALIKSDSTTNAGLSILDMFGLSQALNKCFAGGSSQPTSGTYAGDAIAWNTRNAVAGQPLGYACTAFGTMGTLNAGATTASITNGSPILVVSSATGLQKGNVLNVSGDGALTGCVVMSVSGLNVTVDANASVTTGAAPVSYHAATWKAMPNWT